MKMNKEKATKKSLISKQDSQSDLMNKMCKKNQKVTLNFLNGSVCSIRNLSHMREY